MTIPSITPYPLPGAEQLPSSRLKWDFEAPRAALLIHDMQRYFMDFYTDGFTALTDNIARLRELDVPVYYTAQPASQSTHDRGLLQDRWGPGIDDRTDIVAALAPGSDDTVLTKHRYSAFFGTDLAERLAADGRDQLVICGVYAHIGITATAIDAFSLGVKPFVAADALGDFTWQRHAAALEHLAAICAEVVVVDDLIGGAPTLAQVRAQVLALLDEPVADDDDLIDAGLDSVRVMGLVEQWKAEGRDVDFTDLAADPTVRGFHACLQERR